MTADISYLIFTLRITIFSVFYTKKKWKLFEGFVPTPSLRHCAGPPGRLTVPYKTPSCNRFWLCQKPIRPYFFCIIRWICKTKLWIQKWCKWLRGNMTIQKQHSQMFFKIGALKNFLILTRKHLCWSLFLNKVSGLRLATLTKKRLRHRCFPVNIAKFSRAVCFIEHLWWLLLIIHILELPILVELLLLSSCCFFPLLLTC